MHGLPGALANQIEDGELGSGHTDPERKSLPFIIAVGDKYLVQKHFQIPRIFTREERRNTICENAESRIHATRVGKRPSSHAFRADGPDEKLVITAQHFDPIDDDGLGQGVKLRNRPQPCISDSCL